MSVECICINDAKRPKEIPLSKWVKKQITIKANNYINPNIYENNFRNTQENCH